jgi:hypothetical protein
MKSFSEFLTEKAINEAVGGYKNAATLAAARFIEMLPNREPYIEMLDSLKGFVKAKKYKDIEELFKNTKTGAKQTAYSKLEDFFYGVKTVTTSDKLDMADIDWASIDFSVDHLDR